MSKENEQSKSSSEASSAIILKLHADVERLLLDLDRVAKDPESSRYPRHLISHSVLCIFQFLIELRDTPGPIIRGLNELLMALENLDQGRSAPLFTPKAATGSGRTTPLEEAQLKAEVFAVMQFRRDFNKMTIEAAAKSLASELKRGGATREITAKRLTSIYKEMVDPRQTPPFDLSVAVTSDVEAERWTSHIASISHFLRSRGRGEPDLDSSSLK